MAELRKRPTVKASTMEPVTEPSSPKRAPSPPAPIDAQAVQAEAQAKMQTKPDLSGDFMEVRPSILSTGGPPGDYTGFRNLALLLLALANIRLVVENIMKYGLLVDLSEIFGAMISRDPYRWPSLTIILSMNGFCVCALVFEKLAAGQVLASNVVSLLHAMNCIGAIVVPCYLVWTIPSNPGAAVGVLLFATCCFMKLVSYCHINGVQRRLYLAAKKVGIKPVNGNGTSDAPKEGAEPAPVVYPQNLTILNMYYFIAAPTLCYQLNFPRTERIRKGWLARRVFELFLFSVVILSVVQQWLLPVVVNAMRPINSINIPIIIERLLKLSVPNLCVWLLGFYVLFHVYLNVLAEVLCFGDRLFYQDWWNSTTIERFWRTWNMPVHFWLARHVYLPLRNQGWNRNNSFFICFFVSAVFHEIIISIAFRRIGLPVAFLSMMVQVPLILFSSSFTKGKSVGNIMLWFTLLLGQPLGILYYYFALTHDMGFFLRG